MVIYYFYLMSVTVFPHKTDTPLIIYTNTVLALTISFQGVKMMHLKNTTPRSKLRGIYVFLSRTRKRVRERTSFYVFKELAAKLLLTPHQDAGNITQFTYDYIGRRASKAVFTYEQSSATYVLQETFLFFYDN